MGTAASTSPRSEAAEAAGPPSAAATALGNADPAFVKLFGDTLLTNKRKKAPTAGALEAGKPVAIYFSAHWCPPCRGFTPKLAKWMKQGLADQLQIVFVSSDRDQAAFDAYHGSMPWLALPFEARAVKNALSARFGVRGIPSLVVLDADGALITKDGRAKVTADHGAKCDPRAWAPPSVEGVLFGKDGGAELVVKGGARVKAREHLAGKTVAIYFSAHWCPPCRGFTPKLAETYKILLAAGKPFEIVFVSSDRDQAAFDAYHGAQPWAALPFADRERAAALGEAVGGVSGIPTLVVLGPDGKVITRDARSAVMRDPEGKAFPWADVSG